MRPSETSYKTKAITYICLPKALTFP